MFSVSAPGKIILLGEHAVVHGQPAMAVPLSAVRVMVTVEPGAAGSGVTVHAPEIGETVRVEPHPLALSPYKGEGGAKAGAASSTPTENDGEREGTRAVDALVYPVEIALAALHVPVPDMVLTVRSTIPIASGLGSGAALAAALMRAVSRAVGFPLDNDTLNPLVYEVEKRHHGTPSGIDNTVIVYEKPVYFVRGTPSSAQANAPSTPPVIETFHIARPFVLLVADSGQSSPTKIAVADVRTLYEREPDRIGAIFARIGEIVRMGRAAIESGTIELLGPLMDENHALLRDLTVSSETLDALCYAAREAGAAGAKLSGGGRGGNMIALVTAAQAERVAEALRRAGAVNVIQTTVGFTPP